MKKGKMVLIALGIIVVVLAVAVYFLLSNLDRIVAAAIGKYGSEATGTSVKVSSVRIKLREGEGSISNLIVANPGGFSTPNAVSLGNISMAVDTGSLTADPVIIDKIVVSSPRVTYEINKAGVANIDEIRKNVETYQKTIGSGKGDGGKKEGGKKLLIRSLVVEGGEVDVLVAALGGKPLQARLPRIALSNLGGKGGATPGEVAAQVLNPLVKQAISAASSTGIGQYLGKQAEDVKKALEEKAQEKLGGAGSEAVKGAEESLKKLLGK
jgi:hypothetical protein